MLFDNIKDSYEMNNLVDKAEFRDVQDKMEKLLQEKLKRIGDADFKPARYYLDKFGFQEFRKDGMKVPNDDETKKISKVFSPKKT